MPKILGLIGARGGSKGVPRKNLRNLKDNPLIAYSIAVSKMSRYISRTVVSTDDTEIANISLSYGAEVPFLRPYEYATDTSTDIDWITHALTTIDDSFDYVVHLRPTTPIRNPSIVDEAIAKFLQIKEATSMRSVHKLEESPYKMFQKDDLFLKPYMPFYGCGEFYNLSRQTFPTAYVPNGYVDILIPRIIETGSLHGSRIMAFETSKVTEVDNELDFEHIEWESGYSVAFEKLLDFIKGSV